MNKAVYIVGAFAALGVFAYVTYNNAVRRANDRDELLQRQAQATADQKEKDDLKARLTQLENQVAGTGGAATAPHVPATGGTTPTPRISAADKQRRTAQIIDEGYKLLDSSDPKKVETAAEIFMEGIREVDPQNPLFYAAHARAMFVLSKPKDALASFKKALSLDSKLNDAISGLGWAYWQLHEFPLAKSQWEQAVAANPKSLDAWSGLSWVYLSLGKGDLAVKGFQVLVDSPIGSGNMTWQHGLTMARAGNTDIRQIRTKFWVPDPAAFTPGATTQK